MPSEPELPDAQKAKTFFQYGNEAALKSNFDYAIDMYKQACKLAPVICLIGSRCVAPSGGKFNNDPSKVGMLVGARNQPIRMRARSARSKGKHAHALEICEEAFTHNPWDTATAREASEAAEAARAILRWPSGTWSRCRPRPRMQSSSATPPISHEKQRALAKGHRQLGAGQEARSQRRERQPADQLALGQRHDQARRAGRGPRQAKAGWPRPRRSSRTSSSGSSRSSSRPRTAGSRRFRRIPKQVWPYLNLAEHHRNRSQLDAAEKILAQGLKANPKEPMLLQAYADVQMSRMKRAIESWTQRCKEHPEDTAAKAKLDQITKLLTDYEIKEFRRRVALAPRTPTCISAWPLPGPGRAARRGDRRVPAGPLQPHAQGPGALSRWD